MNEVSRITERPPAPTSTKRHPVTMQAVWLRREGNDAVVLVERDGKFHEIIREGLAGWPEVTFSHIKEPD